MLGVDTHGFKHLVIANVLDHIERIGAAFEQGHGLKRRPPRTIIPQQGNNRDVVFGCGLHIHPAYAQTTVAADHDDLLAWTPELHPNTHTHAVSDWGKRPGVDNLTRLMGGKPLTRIATQGEAIDDEGCVCVDNRGEVFGQPVGMNRSGTVMLLLTVLNKLVIVIADLDHVLEPRALALGAKVKLHLFDRLDHLTQHQLGVADNADFGRDMPANPLGGGINLDIGGFIAPGRGLPEFFSAPEFESNGQHHVSLACKRLFPRTPNGERMVFVNRALAGPTAVHRGAGEFCQFFQFCLGPGPENSVPTGNEWLFRLKNKLNRAFNLARVALEAEFIRTIDFCALALLGLVILVVENIGWNFEQGDALGGGGGFTKRLTQVDFNG